MKKRMIDRLLEHLSDGSTEYRLIDDAQIIVADNMRDYIEDNHFTYADLRPFVNLAPPFEHIWFDIESDHLRGFSMSVIRSEDELAKYAAIYDRPVYPVWCEDTNWMLALRFMQLGASIQQAKYELCFCVGGDGKPIDHHGSPLQFLKTRDFEAAITPAEVMTATDVLAILLCLSLMNSQNVILVETKADIRDGEARVRARAGKPPLRNYYTLKIVPGKRRQLVYNLNDRQPKHTRELSREHWRRGHFRTYTPDAPLFGREGLHGTFWFSPSLVGKQKIGESIEKQYRVLTDRD